jgi:hypothetical protein
MTGAAIRYPVEDWWTAAVAVILVAWLVATVPHQFRFLWWDKVARLDVLNLLPTWTFFAPNPGRHDLHLVYRDWEDGRPLPWRQLEARPVDWRWRWIWNPDRFPRKAVSDLAASLDRQLAVCAGNPAAVTICLPYLSVLQIVMAQPGAARPGALRQFALVASRGFGSRRHLEVRYVSRAHRVDP